MGQTLQGDKKQMYTQKILNKNNMIIMIL